MSEEVRRQAFQPFFTTKERRGTGIGLTIVKNVAEEHSGAAEVASSASGSVISILIPESASTVVVAEPAVANGPDDLDLRPLVLLVEDDADVRRSTARLMEDLGVRVVQASGGHHALQLLRSAPGVDLVVTDVRMPEMTGPELAQHVRSIRPDLPIIYVTGFAEELLRIEPGAAERLLTKPYDVQGLTRLLERALGVALSLPI
jgi:CheY-like chemotaxis protein